MVLNEGVYILGFVLLVKVLLADLFVSPSICLQYWLQL